MVFGFGGGRGRGGKSGGFGRGMRGARRRFFQRRDDFCICPNCRTVVPHQRGVPCYQTICPNCRTPMTRQFHSIESPPIHHQTTPSMNIPYVDEEICTGCKKCLNFCPVGAIEMKDNKAVINASYCNGCLVCIPSCPFGAIKVGENG